MGLVGILQIYGGRLRHEFDDLAAALARGVRQPRGPAHARRIYGRLKVERALECGVQRYARGRAGGLRRELEGGVQGVLVEGEGEGREGGVRVDAEGTAGFARRRGRGVRER